MISGLNIIFGAVAGSQKPKIAYGFANRQSSYHKEWKNQNPTLADYFRISGVIGEDQEVILNC